MRCDSQASLLACNLTSPYLGRKPKARVVTPNPIQNQRPFLSTQTTKQPIVNNLKYNFSNSQLNLKKHLMLVIIFGFVKCIITSILPGFSLVPLLLTKWPRKVIFLQQDIYSSLTSSSPPWVWKTQHSNVEDVLPNSHCAHWNHQQILSRTSPPTP